MGYGLPKITELADQAGNSNGSIVMVDDNACFSCDGGANRIGFVKKAGAVGCLAVDSSHTFAIARSGGGTIDAATNTFTNQFTLDASGNAVVVGSLATGVPSGGSSGAWKLGVAVATSGLTLKTTQYVQLDVGGTLYKVAVCN